MASKKNLKKDIEYLISDVVFDCYALMDEHPEKDFSAYEEIINDIIVVKEDLVERINHFDPGVHGNSRNYFMAIKRDLITSITEAYDNLTKLGA
jgi:hypothetical protein